MRVDIGDEFKSALRSFKAHPGVAVPQAISILMLAVYFIALLTTTGLGTVLQDVIRINQEFEKNNPEPSRWSSERAEWERALQAEYEAAGITQKMEALSNWETGLRFLILSAIFFIATFYASTSAYAAVALTVNGDGPRAKKTLHLTNRLFWRHVGVRIWQLIFLLWPMVVVLMALLLANGHPLIGILSIFFVLLMYVVYLTYIATRLAFCEPALFLQQLGVVDTIGESFRTTRGKFGSALLVLVIVSLISWLAGGLAYRPLVHIFIGLSFSYAAAKIISLGILFVFLLLVHAAIFAIRDLFLFFAYREFRTQRK
jgi:hypothetical protein